MDRRWLSTRVSVRRDGRIVIPARHGNALGAKPGDSVILRLEENGTLSVMLAEAAVRRAQALVRRYIPEGRMLSDELIQERRKESARE